jgi:polysaccharide biosynthesis/export protein
MKPIFFLLLAIVCGIATYAPGQETSTQTIKNLDELSPSQRKQILAQYGKPGFSSSTSEDNVPSASSLTGSGNVAGSEETTFPPNDSGSHSDNENSNRLRILYELEANIQEDLKKLKLDLSERNSDPETLELEAYRKDRQHDLALILREIKALQLEVISQRLKVGVIPTQERLSPFGYSSFDGQNLRQKYYSQLRSTNSAFPANYKIGPGDLLKIHLYGQKDDQYSLAIGRGGVLNFPEIGPINIFEKGNSFENLQNLIKERVNEKFGGGVQVFVGMGGLRQIRVFLAGEFKEPGQILVYAGSSLSNLLMDCGGVTEIASLRTLTLKRKGSKDQVLDLYDLLLRGDFIDATLEEGDMVFLPTVKSRAWVGGEVLRPAIYEFTDDSSLVDVIRLSGGVTNKARRSFIRLYRAKGVDGFVGLKTLDLNTDSAFEISNGDRIEVGKISERNFMAITVEGEVEHPGNHEWYDGQRISDVLRSRAFYTEDADLNYALVRRKGFSGRVFIFAFSPNEVLEGIDSKENIALSPSDKIIILSRADRSKRSRAIRPLLEELQFEGKPGRGVPSVSVNGMVHFPGEYPYTPDMGIGDLIVAGGGMTGSAYTVSAELSRQTVDLNSSTLMASIHHTNLASLLTDNTLSTELRAKDVLSIKPIPAWSEKNTIEIFGEVQFPGSYTFQKNETLRSVFKRAGGYTDSAFPRGAIFTRLNLIAREEEQKKRLIIQLETDLANISLAAGSEGTSAKAKSVADGLLARLRNSKSTGRLVIDLDEQVAREAESSIVVRDGDKLFVPSLPYEVSVVGEVQFATSHLFNSKLDIKHYIQRSGGFTANADENRVFAVKSNGSVLTKANSGWFKSSNNNSSLEAGDVIVVPIDLEKGRWLETLTSGTQVVYQLAVTAAAVNSF